jgi:hypothetical protein
MQEVEQRMEQLPRASVGLKAGIGPKTAMHCRFFSAGPPNRAIISGYGGVNSLLSIGVSQKRGVYSYTRSWLLITAKVTSHSEASHVGWIKRSVSTEIV